MKYCNPWPFKAKLVIIMPQAVILQSRVNPFDCSDSFRPAAADWLRPTTICLYTSLPSDPVIASAWNFRCNADMKNLIPFYCISLSTHASVACLNSVPHECKYNGQSFTLNRSSLPAASASQHQGVMTHWGQKTPFKNYSGKPK